MLREKAIVTKKVSDAGLESMKYRRLEAMLRLLKKIRESTFTEDVIDVMRPPCYIGRSDNEIKIREIDVRTSRFKDITFRDNKRLKKKLNRSVLTPLPHGERWLVGYLRRYRCKLQ